MTIKEINEEARNKKGKEDDTMISKQMEDIVSSLKELAKTGQAPEDLILNLESDSINVTYGSQNRRKSIGIVKSSEIKDLELLSKVVKRLETEGYQDVTSVYGICHMRLN